MDLVLWRHAEAQEWTDGCDDLARPLTPRGVKQAARMARWLDRQLPHSARILVSSAQRAEQTVAALGRPHKVTPALNPDATLAQLLALVPWQVGAGALVLVGHQPVLGQAISQLIGLSGADCPVKKGAIWWLRCRQRGDVLQTVVVSVQSPEML